MNIKGTVTNIRSQHGGPHAYSGAFYDTGSKGERDQANGGSEPNAIGFDASKNWTGSTSEEKSHTHTFSSSATIGSGNYTRPNSTSTLIIIRY